MVIILVPKFGVIVILLKICLNSEPVNSMIPKILLSQLFGSVFLSVWCCESFGVSAIELKYFKFHHFSSFFTVCLIVIVTDISKKENSYFLLPNLSVKAFHCFQRKITNMLWFMFVTIPSKIHPRKPLLKDVFLWLPLSHVPRDFIIFFSAVRPLIYVIPKAPHARWTRIISSKIVWLWSGPSFLFFFRWTNPRQCRHRRVLSIFIFLCAHLTAQMATTWNEQMRRTLPRTDP